MVNTKDVPKKIIEGMRFSSKCDGIYFYFGCTDTFGLLWELSRKGNSSLRQHLARVKGNRHDFLALEISFKGLLQGCRDIVSSSSYSSYSS